MLSAGLLSHSTASFSGLHWETSVVDERLALALSQRFSVPDVVARVMAARGITLDDAADFLDPTLRALLPDPFLLKDMDKAAARMVAAITAREKICVFGDYDVDGATSTALILRYGRVLGVSIGAYIPDRLKEGYGPNSAALRTLAAEGVKLVITVDCGTTAHEPLTVAREAGLDVLVLDHHAGEPLLPPAHAVVNPNRLDESSPHRHMAAVGVTFLFLVAVNAKLRDAGFFKDGTAPDLLQELDLVALGTVADVVSLTGVNRALVRQGLRVLASTHNAGLAALLRASRNTGVPDSYTAGFLLGPRVNAGGRVGKSDLGARLLATDDVDEAARLAAMLEKLNEERRAIETLAVDEAVASVAHDHHAAAALLVASDHWHPGVIGLVASRLKERYGRPSLVTAFMNDVGKGSCRSVKGVDIGAIIIAAKQEGLLVNGGGHAMAAGFTVMRGAYETFKIFVENRVAKILAETPLEPTLTIDGALTVAGATVDLAEKIQMLAPFGAGNPEPRFAVLDAVLHRAEIMAEKHLRLQFTDERGNYLRAVAWRAMDNHLGPALTTARRGARFDVAGHLRLNVYALRTDVQLVVDDVRQG